jgi:hypothetical protein
MNALLILLLAVSADGAPENHILASLVTTNRPGHYLLPTTWEGHSQLTIAKGLFRFGTNRLNNTYKNVNFISYVPWVPDYDESSHRTLSDRDVSVMNETNRLQLIKTIAGDSGYAYRKLLPSDNDLDRCETLSQLKEKLGEFHPPSGGRANHGPDGTEYDGLRQWALFALGVRDTIEILEVVSVLEQITGSKEAAVRSLLVIRYTLKPADTPAGGSPQLERR